MRQSLAKGQRRELRRAMGIGALSAMKEQDQAIAILSNALTTCQREIATLAINHAEFKQLITATLRAHDAVQKSELSASWRRPLLARFRWLFTGK